MNEDYIEKLVSDIQHFLQEEDKHKGVEWESEHHAEASPEYLRKPLLIGLIMILSACAVGSITVVILLLGLVGTASSGPVDVTAMLAVGGCGIFFCAMLVSVWKRLELLRHIEKNTRLILESKQRANALLEYFIQNME
jgi:hypothetical protein